MDKQNVVEVTQRYEKKGKEKKRDKKIRNGDAMLVIN